MVRSDHWRRAFTTAIVCVVGYLLLSSWWFEDEFLTIGGQIRGSIAAFGFGLWFGVVAAGVDLFLGDVRKFFDR